jgi:hypothetical protein
MRVAGHVGYSESFGLPPHRRYTMRHADVRRTQRRHRRRPRTGPANDKPVAVRTLRVPGGLAAHGRAGSWPPSRRQIRSCNPSAVDCVAVRRTPRPLSRVPLGQLSAGIAHNRPCRPSALGGVVCAKGQLSMVSGIRSSIDVGGSDHHRTGRVRRKGSRLDIPAAIRWCPKMQARQRTRRICRRHAPASAEMSLRAKRPAQTPCTGVGRLSRAQQPSATGKLFERDR